MLVAGNEPSVEAVSEAGSAHRPSDYERIHTRPPLAERLILAWTRVAVWGVLDRGRCLRAGRMGLAEGSI